MFQPEMDVEAVALDGVDAMPVCIMQAPCAMPWDSRSTVISLEESLFSTQLWSSAQAVDAVVANSPRAEHVCQCAEACVLFHSYYGCGTPGIWLIGSC